MSEFVKLKELAEAATGVTDVSLAPDVILDLIAENEKLKVDLREVKDAKLGLSWAIGRIMGERDQLRVDCDQFAAEIDEDKLHFQAMGQALEGVVAERDKLKAELFEESMMSECMRQFRADMIELGVVVESCPPMMMTEGVAGYIGKLKAECEGLRKDAGRYRWLRDSSESIHQFYLSTPIWFTGVKFSKENVDSTIDAAMGKGERS